jgi:tetratricopeptide (TPR) repeat protein
VGTRYTRHYIPVSVTFPGLDFVIDFVADNKSMNRNLLGGGNSGTPASDVFARPPPSENVATTYYPSSTGGVDVELPEKRPPSANPTLPPPPIIPQAPRTAPPNMNPSLQTYGAVEEANMSLDDLADAFLLGSNETTTVCLSPDPLPAEASDMERLQILVRRRAWKDVLSYTKLFLEKGSKSHYSYLYDAILTPGYLDSPVSSNSAIELALDTHKQDLVYIFTVHITAMVKLSLFSELAGEVERWTFCFHHTKPRRLFLWIPWTFHILAASTLQYGRFGTSTAEADLAASYQHSLDALWAIRDAIADGTEVEALVQVENTLHNIFIAMKDWRMALDCQQRIMKLAPGIAKAEISKLRLKPSDLFASFSDQKLTTAYRLECLARQGRIFLQIGAVDHADILFRQSRSEWNAVIKNDTTLVSQDGSLRSANVIEMFVLAQLSSSEGLLYFSLGKYEEALESFRSAIVELKSALYAPSGLRRTETDPLESRCHALYSESINNMALCALYTCRLAEALQLMESLVRENVMDHLTERVTLNLCTLYELSMDSNAALCKKKVLQHIASRFLLQDIPVECFRVG